MHRDGQTSGHWFDFPFWRSSKTIRALLIGAIAIMLALLAGLGIHAIWRSLATREHGDERRQRINQPVENHVAKPPQKVKDLHAAEAETGGGSTDKDSPARHGKNDNPDGGTR
jgi:hypothetical protein